MMLLTDEEQMRAYDFDWCEGNIGAVAKAQLKKVVEWGDEECSKHGGGRFKRECRLCWQALLKEIE